MSGNDHDNDHEKHQHDNHGHEGHDHGDHHDHHHHGFDPNHDGSVKLHESLPDWATKDNWDRFGLPVASAGSSYAMVQAVDKLPIEETAKRLLYGISILPLYPALAPDIKHAIEAGHIDHLLMQGLTAAAATVGAGTGNKELIEGADILTAIFGLSNGVEGNITARYQEAIKQLYDSVPKTVNTIHDDHHHEELIQNVAVGDRIKVFPGERIPLDGKVISIGGRTEANGTVNSSVADGQFSNSIKTGSEILQGTIVDDQVYEIEVTRDHESSTLASILHVLQDATPAESQTKVGAAIESWVYVLAGLSAIQFGAKALQTGSGPNGFSLKNVDLGESVTKALELGIKGAPCPLAASQTYWEFVKHAFGGDHGVYMWNMHAVEEMQNIKVLLSDMTGTLTEGKPVVEQFDAFDAKGHALGEAKQHALLENATKLELYSKHPIADAIRDFASDKSISTSGNGTENIDNVQSEGVKATINGQHTAIGKLSFIRDSFGNNITIPQALIDRGSELETEGKSVVYYAETDNKNQPTQFGCFALDDPIRNYEATRNMVKKFRDEGKTFAILTGEPNGNRVHGIAEALGVDPKHVHFGLSADEKVTLAQHYRTELKNPDTTFLEKPDKKGTGIIAAAVDAVNDLPLATEISKDGVVFGVGNQVAAATQEICSVGIKDVSQVPALMNASEKSTRLTTRSGVIGTIIMGALTISHILGIEIGPKLAAILHELPTVVITAFSGFMAKQTSKEFGEASASIEKNTDKPSEDITHSHRHDNHNHSHDDNTSTTWLGEVASGHTHEHTHSGGI